ncbi:LacI family DNA-binding transcriptional regulator [Propylenella binzhouense]|nr:LacI family DNA-binding transcriptional regulator [Propylenella binzhouense]
MGSEQKRRGSGITMSDVARAVGVSAMTVSNTFRNPDIVQPETRKRVLAIASKLGYVPNSIAGNLTSGQSRVIAVVTPSIRNSNFADMIICLERALTRAGYHLIISMVETDEKELPAMTALVGRRVDGIVIAGNILTESARELLRKTTIPVVETWNINGPAIDMVAGFSERDAGESATRLLIESGCRRIGLLCVDNPLHSRYGERQRGFEDALKRAGLDSGLVVRIADKSGYGGGATGIADLIDRAADLDGVFCMTDVLAVGALFECQRRGIQVPSDLSIVGFGDYEIAKQIPPGLTTVHSPGDRIGEVAAELILARLNGDPGVNRRVDTGFHLVRRGSA